MRALVLALSLALAPPALGAPGAGPALLGSGEVTISGCSSSLFFAGAQVGIAIGPAEIYGADVSAASAPGLAGDTVVLTAASGEPFLQAVQALTDGTIGHVHYRVQFGGGPEGCQTWLSEPFFFTFSGLACPNGVDFAGAMIERIELRIDQVFFGPNGGLPTTLRVEGELLVYGEDPAPCVPPRFQRDLVPAAQALPAALSQTTADGPVLWRLWVERSDLAHARRSGPPADVLLVSTQSTELLLAAGTLACDPSPEALLLARPLAPGESVWLAGPSSIVVQVASWSEEGLRLSPSLRSEAPR